MGITYCDRSRICGNVSYNCSKYNRIYRRLPRLCQALRTTKTTDTCYQPVCLVIVILLRCNIFWLSYCLCLSFIQEKASGMAVFWTGWPHSLGSCHFWGVAWPILAFQIMNFSPPLFASLQLDWATITDRLLGPATCLPHKDGTILLSVLPKDATSKLAGLFFHSNR